MSNANLPSTTPGPDSRAWLVWMMLGTVLALAAVLALCIDRLHERADEYRCVETELALLEADTHELNALEWEVHSQEQVGEDVSSRWEQVLTRMNGRFSHLEHLGARLPRLEDVRKNYRFYVRLADQEFRLVANSKIKEAGVLDAGSVDPAFMVLEASLEETGATYATMADHTLSLIRAGSALVMFVGAAFIALLFWQFNRKLRALAVVAAERSALVQVNEQLESRVGERTAELTALNQQMESRIEERTGELQQINRALQAEIQERTRAEAARLEAEAGYRALFEKSLDGIVILDVETGRPREFNETAHRQLGYTREEFARLSISEFESLEAPEETAARMAKILRDGGDDFETCHRTRQGEIRNVHVTVQVIQISGRPTCICIFRDITERKQAETLLRVQSSALDAAANAIAITDASGTIELVNPAFTTLTGYTAAEAVGQNPRILRSGKQDAAFFRNLWQTISAGRVWSGELINRRKDGSLYAEEMTITPLRNPAGEIVRYIAIKQDVTKRKRAETALIESKLFLKSTLDALSSHIAILDEHGTILEVNAAWHRFACENKFQGDHHGVGENYLKVCDSVSGPGSESASAVAGGIRAVIAGQTGEFRLEYPCHSPHQQRWFVVRVTRFVGEGRLRVVVAHENISDRKRSEELLLDSQALYHSLVEHLPAGVFRKDTAGRYTFVNSMFCRLKGLQAEEIIGKTPVEVSLYEEATLAPGSSAATMKRQRTLAVQGTDDHERIMSTGESLSGEEFYSHPDGTTEYFQTLKGPVYNADGKLIGTQGIQFDVTQRKQAEEALRASDEKFQQLADNITDAFWIRSPDLSAVHYVSPAFERIWGRPVASVYAHPESWAEWILPADRERVLAAFAALKGDAASLDIEYRITRPDGEIRWVHVRGFQVRDVAYKLVRHTGIVTDITGRKLAESMIRRSEERYRSLIENARDAIFTLAVEGSITLLNPAVEAIAGIKRADWVGKSFVQLVHPDDQPLAREMFQRIMDGAPAPVHELRGHPGLPRQVLIEMTTSAQKDEHGKIIGLLGIGRDITERKRLEAQLFQSQKLETVGKLAGGIAHEFNSLLTGIIGQSELLLGELPVGSPLAESATEIGTAALRAATLTRQLLAYGRKQFLQPKILDVNRVIANMEGVLHHLMGSEVAVQLVPAAGLPMVKVDAGQMEQVIMNLAMNARDAMPHGGKLALETANVVFDLESVGGHPELPPGEYVMLAISDTGTGMSEAVKARVFEPFFTTKGIGQGTGLGLSTCYGIVKQSGGHISVYTEPGRGTTFKIYLPQVEPAAKAAVERLDTPGLPRGTETILLVEDDAVLREMAATLLERLGYTVLSAASGVEALSLGQQPVTGHIDLLFTDVVMPEMSGKELADQVRMWSPETRILFTSGFTQQAIVHQGGLGQDAALLQKPFTPSVLARKVREVLDQPAVPPTAAAPGIN